MDNYFQALNDVNVNGHTEKKNGLTYLSWAWAWGEIKKRYPDATYTIYESDDGCFYHTDGRTCWVKTGVTVCGVECIEYLPVMDYKNKSIPLDSVTSFDVNKAIQRSLTKACARHGLGLYIYAGEDLPESEADAAGTEKKPNQEFKQISKEDYEKLLRVLSTNGISVERMTKAMQTKFGGSFGLNEITYDILTWVYGSIEATLKARETKKAE